MIRHTVAGLGMLAVVTITALAVPAAASAAAGNLYINRQTYQNPSGCISYQAQNAFIYNQTDLPVMVFDNPDCHGLATTVIGSGNSQNGVRGQSILVPQGS